MKKVHFPGPSKSKTFLSKKSPGLVYSSNLPGQSRRLSASNSNPALVKPEADPIDDDVSGFTEDQSNPNYSLFSDFESGNTVSPAKEIQSSKNFEKQIKALKEELDQSAKEKAKVEAELKKEKKKTKKLEKDAKEKNQKLLEEKEAWQEEKAELFSEINKEKNEKLLLKQKASEIELEITSQKSKYEGELLKIMAQIRGLKSLQAQFHEEKQNSMSLQNALENSKKEAELFRSHLKGNISFFLGILDEIHTQNNFDSFEKSKPSGIFAPMTSGFHCLCFFFWFLNGHFFLMLFIWL